MSGSTTAPTITQLETTLRMLAYVVVRHGEVYGPLLERVERFPDSKRDNTTRLTHRLQF